MIKTIDLVNDVTLSHTSGFSTYKDNMGEVVNKGVEVEVVRIYIVIETGMSLFMGKYGTQ